MSANFKKDPITTTVGLIMCLVAVFMWIAPYFIDVADSLQGWYIPFGVLVLGIIALRAPDTFVWGARKAVEKKIGKKEGQ